MELRAVPGTRCIELLRTTARILLMGAALGLAPLAGAQLHKKEEPQREGVDVGKSSSMARLVPAAEVENAATQQYHQLLQQAAAKRALAPQDHPQMIRLRAISQRLIPQAPPWNERARSWKWEVNLIGSNQVNAFCMQGGKIAFYSGIFDQLKLTDDEAAMVLGHEMAHALREHARARMAKSMATQGAARVGGAVVASIFGIDPRFTDLVARGGANLLTLTFSRSDESEADLVGMEMAARAGYDPRAAVTLWKKMGQINKGAPPQWLSTHPSGTTRIADIEKNLPRVLPLYDKARRG
ncbi:MAG: M48 family metallopeptidase [Burkholderiales bacterium]|nr:M48 family metallopeptidase [Burkholderiales bacterium]